MNKDAQLAEIALMREADPEFRVAVESLPDDHWAKRDLSAARWGWEAHKALIAGKLTTPTGEST